MSSLFLLSVALFPVALSAALGGQVDTAISVAVELEREERSAAGKSWTSLSNDCNDKCEGVKYTGDLEAAIDSSKCMKGAEVADVDTSALCCKQVNRAGGTTLGGVYITVMPPCSTCKLHQLAVDFYEMKIIDAISGELPVWGSILGYLNLASNVAHKVGTLVNDEHKDYMGEVKQAIAADSKDKVWKDRVYSQENCKVDEMFNLVNGIASLAGAKEIPTVSTLMSANSAAWRKMHKNRLEECSCESEEEKCTPAANSFSIKEEICKALPSSQVAVMQDNVECTSKCKMTESDVADRDKMKALKDKDSEGYSKIMKVMKWFSENCNK